MAVLGRLLVSSAERLDLPDLLSLDSYAAGDWKYFLKGIVGSDKPYILKGFDVIDPTNAIGTQSCSIRVADSVVFYPGSNSGSFFHGLEEGHPQASPLVPELRKNAINYVYLTFSTFNTSVDTRAFWDPDKDGGVVGGEFTQDINTESVLKVDVNVSTGSFPANTIPIAKITVGPVVITAIEDARDLMFRLGNGGINPNPFNTYGWRSLPNNTYARQEPPTQMLAGGVNPFQGADKNILTLKEWMDAIMSKLRELGGTTYWYDDTSSFSIITNFYDAVATAFKSKGKWIHDTATPGLLTWTEDVQIKMTSDPRTYIIRQGSKNLADEQVMWLDMQRNLVFNTTDENVQWINGQPYVNTIGGAVGLFANLSKGDYIKKANDTIDKWVRVEEFYDAVSLGGSTTTAAGARSVRLGSSYLGGTGAEKGRYDKGVYLPADVQVTDRDVAGIAVAGGRFHWLALRSDTIENVGNAVTTSLSVAIDQHDGSTARVTSTAHGLVDGDRVTITGTTNFDGTYQVEVETADIFYINVSGGPFADESGSAYYAVITTAARLTPYGFQEESSNHGFNSNDTITIDATTNYDGQYLINVRNTTTFQIPMPGPAATETSGTATLARVIVRNEGGVSELVQGEIIDIGGSAVDNIRQYIGMQSLSETAPTYNIPPSYNTLDGMANYNGVINENLTIRIAKLTAMMADKAQDKTIKFLPSNGITTITNTQNGSAQELRFLPDGASLTIVTPSSDGQTFLALPDTANPLSLLQNQAAYVQIDRNNPSTVTMTVASIADVPLEENTFVIAVRINTPDIYIWDGSIITVGSQPAPAYLSTIVRQNQALKLVEGGTWSWDLGTETLTWSADAFVQVPGLANSVNQIVAGSAVLAAGEVAYIDINRVGPGGTLTVNVALNSALNVTTDMFIIARRETTDVIVGLHSMRLIDGESKKIYAGSSDQNLTYTGATSNSDAAPQYSSNNIVVNSTSLTTAIGALDAAAGVSASNSNQDRSSKLIEGGTWSLNAAGTALTLSASAFVQIPGLENNRNEIAAQTITFPNANSVAYVEVARATPGTAAILTVQVADVSMLVPTDNTVIIARRVTDGILVGQHSFLLKAGEFLELDGALAEVNRLLGRLKITEHADADKVSIASAAANLLDGAKLNQVIGSFFLDFAGSNIDFTTGTISAGGSFTPFSIPVGQYFWYGISLLPSTLNADNTQTVTVQVDQGASANAVAATAPKPILSGTIKLGAVQVYNNAGNIEVVEIRRLATGAGSGGGGETVNLIGGGNVSRVYIPEVLGFNTVSGFDHSVSVVVKQTDNKLVCGGLFNSFDGNTRNYLTRLNANGTEDAAFYTNLGTGFNNTVHRVAIQSDGKILVAGAFTTFNGNTRNRLVKLNSDGTEDAAFYTNLGTGFNGEIYGVSVDSTGQIIVTGTFTDLNGNTRNYIAKLNSDGTEDTAFYTNLGTAFGSTTRRNAVLSDDSIIVTGAFTTFNGNTRNRLVKLNSDGTEDAAFYTNLGTAFNSTTVMVRQVSDKIYVSGGYTTFNGNTRNRLVKLNSDGTEDAAFYTNLGTGFDNGINDLAECDLGSLIVGGVFTALNGNTRNYIAKLNSDGTEDTAFYTNLGTAFSSSLQYFAFDSANNGIVTVGGFTTLNGNTRNRILKLNTDGTEFNLIGTPTQYELHFDAPIYLEKVGLNYADNTIPTTESPIIFTNNEDVAYVTPNLSSGGGNLTVSVGQLDTILSTHLPIARRINEKIILNNFLKQPEENFLPIIDFYDPISTVLPTGTSYVVDGIAAVNGDVILFSNLTSGNNIAYRISGVGVAIDFNPLIMFESGSSPASGDLVIIRKGNTFATQKASFNGITWKVNNPLRIFDAQNWVEKEYIHQINLLASQTGTAISELTFDLTVYEAVEITYKINEATSNTKAIKTIKAVYDGTSVGSSDVGADTGTSISLDAQVSGGNLEIIYDSGGNTATMQAFIKKFKII